MKNVNTLTNDELRRIVSAFYTVIRFASDAGLSEQGREYHEACLMEWQARIEDGRIERQPA